MTPVFDPEDFPITFEALHPFTRKVVWRAHIERPEDLALLELPPLAKQLGHRVIMRITFNDDTAIEAGVPDAH